MDNLKYLTKEQLLERYSELQQEYIDLQNENESLNDYVYYTGNEVIELIA